MPITIVFPSFPAFVRRLEPLQGDNGLQQRAYFQQNGAVSVDMAYFLSPRDQGIFPWVKSINGPRLDVVAG